VSGSDADLLEGKYRLGEELGSGGMGVVYRARHLVLERDVAVKLMHVSGDSQLAGRFLREARVAAAVRHQNVVDVLDFGTTRDGRPFMVLELLEGRSLADALDAVEQDRAVEGRITLGVAERIDVIAQLLSGLEAVHRAGMVHRDVKPANVFLTPRGDGGWFARLLDFGISFAIAPGSDNSRGRFGTVDGLILGTPEYMSAEQCEGRPDVDARSDLYSVGVMLYELLSGVLPYSSPHPGAVLRDVMLGKHVPFHVLRPDLSELALLIEDAISNDRARRPQTAALFRERLIAAADSVVSPLPPAGPTPTRALPTPLPPQPQPAPALARAARGRLGAALVGTAVIAVVGLIGLAARWSAEPSATETAGASAPVTPAAPTVERAAPTSVPATPEAPETVAAPSEAPAPSAAAAPTAEGPGAAPSKAPVARARGARRTAPRTERSVTPHGAGRIVRELDF
jgi:serine/threonine-protein kinase